METQQKKAVFKPWSSEESFRLLVENLDGYAIFMLDSIGRVASWNKGAERLFGYKENEILGTDFSILFTEKDKKLKKPLEEMQEASVKGKSPDRRFHVHKDGSKFFVDGVLVPMRDDFGAVNGYIKLIHRISESI